MGQVPGTSGEPLQVQGVVIGSVFCSRLAMSRHMAGHGGKVRRALPQEAGGFGLSYFLNWVESSSVVESPAPRRRTTLNEEEKRAGQRRGSIDRRRSVDRMHSIGRIGSEDSTHGTDGGSRKKRALSRRAFPVQPKAPSILLAPPSRAQGASETGDWEALNWDCKGAEQSPWV